MWPSPLQFHMVRLLAVIEHWLTYQTYLKYLKIHYRNILKLKRVGTNNTFKKIKRPVVVPVASQERQWARHTQL